MRGYFCIGFIDFVLAGKTLTDYANLFSPHDFKKNDNIIFSYFKNEWIQFCWNNWQNKVNWTNKISIEINKIENYFIEEINQTKSCSKNSSKYVAVFDYIDQAVNALSATSGKVSIISFTSIVGAPVRIASASLTFIFFSNNRNN